LGYMRATFQQAAGQWPTGLLVILLLCVSTALRIDAKAQDRRPHQWWKSDEVRTLLKLTDHQTSRLERIYQQTLPKRHESMERLKSEERNLSLLVADMGVEENDITRQIDRVEAARSELSKTRILMVFRMYRVLDAKQRSAMKTWWENRRNKHQGRRDR